MKNIDVVAGLVYLIDLVVCVFRKGHLDSIRACALGVGAYTKAR